MRNTIRTAVAATALVAGSLLLAPASPAGAGTCYYAYVYATNPPAGATVCTP